MQQLVRRDYIHTLECFASSMLCGWWLKVVRGKDGAASLKTLSNNLDATLTAGAGGTEHKCTCHYCPIFLTIKRRAAFPPTSKEVGFHAVDFS